MLGASPGTMPMRSPPPSGHSPAREPGWPRSLRSGRPSFGRRLAASVPRSRSPGRRYHADVPSVELIPIPADASAEDVGRVFGDELPQVRDAVAATLSWYVREPRGAPWLGYLAGDAATGRIVGTCSFKTEPRDDVVEIAYHTFPGFEGKGYATAMARALVEIAAAHGVCRVSAQTAPEPNASTRILEKLRFSRAGDAVDDEIGPAWAWERPASDGVDGNGS